MQMGRKLGMRLLNDSLLELVKSGVVDPTEAYIKAVNKDAGHLGPADARDCWRAARDWR
jgi:hypothetical protein